MDQRLEFAARTGRTDTLNELLEEDPLVLQRIFLTDAVENPLHIAALAGEANFVSEMVKRMPSFAYDLNKYGFSPLHLAAANGHVDVVTEILTLGPELCLLKDKNGFTPLHHAAKQGRVAVIDKLVEGCPHAINELNAMGQSAIHQAVMYNKSDAVRVLIQHLMGHNNLNGQEPIQLTATPQGSTQSTPTSPILNQERAIQLLVSPPKDKKNTVGEEITPIKAEVSKQLPKPNVRRIKKRSKINRDMQNALLVVAVLITTVTYQAGLTPPAGLARTPQLIAPAPQLAPSTPQSDSQQEMRVNINCIRRKLFSKPTVRHSIHNCPDITLYFFMLCNTAGFVSSIALILLALRRCTRDCAACLLSFSVVSMLLSYVLSSAGMSFNIPSFIAIWVVALVILSSYVSCVLFIMKPSYRNRYARALVRSYSWEPKNYREERVARAL